MTDEEKWRKEAEEAFKFNPVYHSQHDFTLGYLAACRKRQKTIDLYYEATQACLNEGHFSENTKVKIKKALEAIREQGVPASYFLLIDSTLQEIGETYRPGSIQWVREHPDQWSQMLSLEGRINTCE